MSQRRTSRTARPVGKEGKSLGEVQTEKPLKSAVPGARKPGRELYRVPVRKATETPRTFQQQGPATKRAQRPAPALPPGNRLKVTALADGFYNNKRRREGDVFVIERAHFSKRWMNPVDATTPSRVTTGAQVLKRQHDETLAATGGDPTKLAGAGGSSEEEEIFE